MYIKKLHITAFGPISDAELTFDEGINVIEGKNESGKTAVAMFIKFIFYGLSSSSSGGIMPERQRYVSWTRGYAAGWAICVRSDGQEMRIERNLSYSTHTNGKLEYKESVKILDNETNMPIKSSVSPGEFLFGVSEQVFVNSAFAGQLKEVRPDSSAVRESIENIICSADETVSVKKAAEILDRARIGLLHKNRNGGAIFELEGKRDTLISQMNETCDSSARIIQTEASLDDVQKKRSEAAEKKAYYEELFSYLDVLMSAKKLEAAKQAELKLNDIDSEIAKMNNCGVNDSFLASLAVCKRDLARYQEHKKDYDEMLARSKTDDDASPTAKPDPKGDLEKSKKLSSGNRISFMMSMIFMIIGILGIIGTSFLFLAGSPASVIACVITALVIAFGIGSFILNGRLRAKLDDILDFWDAEDVETIEEAIEKKLDELSAVEAQEREFDSIKVALIASESAAREASDLLDNLAKRIGLGPEMAEMSTIELLDAVDVRSKECFERKKSLETESAEIAGRLSELREQTSGLNYEETIKMASEIIKTPVGRSAAALNQESIKAAVREKNFYFSKYEELGNRENELEKTLAALRATADSPANAAERLSELNTKIDRMKAAHNAYILATETLKTAGENLRSGIIPSITSQASRMMSRVTSGRYCSVGVSPSFEMNFISDGLGTREIDFLSSGTRDAAYIALRIALVNALYDRDRRPPLIFDESFVRLDEERTDSALQLISDSEMEVQSFIFTCRSFEGYLADKYKYCKTHLPEPSERASQTMA